MRNIEWRDHISIPGAPTIIYNVETHGGMHNILDQMDLDGWFTVTSWTKEYYELQNDLLGNMNDLLENVFDPTRNVNSYIHVIMPERLYFMARLSSMTYRRAHGLRVYMVKKYGLVVCRPPTAVKYGVRATLFAKYGRGV